MSTVSTDMGEASHQTAKMRYMSISASIVRFLTRVNVAGLMVFAVLYGMGDGIKTITMGTLPLALFGPEGFGARLGWIAFIRMSVNSSSPFLFAWITEAYGGWTSFSAMALFILMGLGALFFVKRHSK